MYNADSVCLMYQCNIVGATNSKRVLVQTTGTVLDRWAYVKSVGSVSLLDLTDECAVEQRPTQWGGRGWGMKSRDKTGR